MRQSREHLRQKDAKADKCTKENYKQSFPNSGKRCNFFGWFSICFTGNLGHTKRNLIRFEPLPVLQIPPNPVSNLTGGNGQKSPHRSTSGRPSAPCLLLPSQRGHRRAKRRGAGAAGTPERGGLRTWPPLPQTRHLSSAPRCLALPGTRRPALPSACSSRPAPQELSRGPGLSPGPAASTAHGPGSRQGWPRTAPAWEEAAGGKEGRKDGAASHCPAGQARPPGPLRKAAWGRARRPSPAFRGGPAVSRGLPDASQPPRSPCPGGLRGRWRSSASLRPGAAGAGQRARAWVRVCAAKAEESGGRGGKRFIGMGFAHPDVLVVLL